MKNEAGAAVPKSAGPFVATGTKNQYPQMFYPL